MLDDKNRIAASSNDLRQSAEFSIQGGSFLGKNILNLKIFIRSAEDAFGDEWKHICASRISSEQGNPPYFTLCNVSVSNDQLESSPARFTKVCYHNGRTQRL